MPLTTVSITGTIYKTDGSVVGANRSVTVVKVIKSGELVTLTRKIYKTDINGLVTMTIPASSTAYIYANATGLDTNGIAGIPVTIPDTDADLSDLVTQASVPEEGITVKDEGISLANLVGTLNFVGSGVSVAEASPGVATVTISGGGGGGGSLTVEEVDGAPSATSVDTLKFDSADGFVLTNPSAGVARVDLAAIPYSKLTLTSSIVAGDLSDVELAAIAGLTSAADRLPYFTGSGTASLATFTSFGRSLVDDADNTAARSTLGLVIGTDVEAHDADLTTIAGLAPTNDDILQRKAGAWTNRTVAQYKSDLSLNNVENTALSTWAGSTNLTTLGTVSTGSWNATAIGIGKGGTGAALTDPNADRIMFWDDSAGAVDWLTVGSNLSITGTTLNAAGGGGTITGTDTHVMFFDGTDNPAGDAGMTYNKTTDTLSLAGAINIGTGSSSAGAFVSVEGTAPSLTANAFSIYSPTDVAAGGLAYVLPGAAATGVMFATNSSGVHTISHESTSGSGAFVRATSASLTTPDIGTPTAGTLTSCTGLPITTGVSGLGSGVATFLATPSSSNLAAAVTDETGSGALVFDTSPAFTTSITTGSTTFALLNTTATTVNAFGAATTLNIGASAATVLNFGGSTSAAEFRFLEPSGSGTNYTAFKAQAQSANITYTLPATVGGAGTILTDAAGNGTLSWGAAGSGTVTVVGAGSLTSTALVTGGGSQTLQTPAATATMDSSGNISTPGTVTSGAGSSVGGTVTLGEGTAPSLTANAFSIYAPTDVAAGGLAYVVPAAAASGVLRAANSSGVMTLTHDAGISHLAASSSADLRGVLSDENGTGAALFSGATSPDFTTSITTGSTTFALLNTTATTVNAFGAATTLNIGASAATVVNLGGSTSAAELRFLEPSGSGTNYTAFKAKAQTANITYTLPDTVGAAGTYLKDAAGDGVLSWATPAGGGGSPGGSNTQVQYNNSSSFGGITNATTDGTTLTLTSPKVVTGINDTNGNELFLLTATGSAVNELTYANAATGNNPKWTASGGDTDIGFDWLVKGAGVYRFLASASGPTDVRWFEDSDNGTNYVSLIAPASLSGNVVLTLPSTTGTVALTSQLPLQYINMLGDGSVLPDSSGNVFLEPYPIKATNDFWKHSHWIFNDTATDDSLYGKFELNQASTGSATITMVWTSTATSGNVRYTFSYRVITADDTNSLDQTTSVEDVTITDTAPTAANRRMSVTFTPTNSNFATAGTVEWKLTRTGTSGSDTMAAAAQLVSLTFSCAV